MIQTLQQDGHRHELVDSGLIHPPLLENAHGSFVLRANVLTDTHLTVGTLADQHPNPIVVHEGVLALEHPVSFGALHAVEHALEFLLLLHLVLLLFTQNRAVWRDDICVQGVVFASTGSHPTSLVCVFTIKAECCMY